MTFEPGVRNGHALEKVMRQISKAVENVRRHVTLSSCDVTVTTSMEERISGIVCPISSCQRQCRFEVQQVEDNVKQKLRCVGRRFESHP